MNDPIVKSVEASSLQYGSIQESCVSSTHSLPVRGKSSICGVLGNVLNAMIGAGILAIPYVYAEIGLFGGLILMIVFALICTYTLNLLIKAAQNLKVTEYEDLGHVSLGSIGYISASACLFLMDFGSMVNYFIILGDSAFKVLQIFGYDQYYERQLIIVAVSMIIIFPPCLYRDISFYEKFSVVKMLAVALVVSVVIYQYFTHRILMHYTNDGYNESFMPQLSDITWFDINGFGPAMGIVAYTFVCHDTAFIYYNTLLNPTTTRWSLLCIAGILLAMLVSLCLSIPAYLTFGDDCEGNILNNYEVSDPTMILTRCIYVITMALTYPTAFFVVRHVVIAWTYKLITKYRNDVQIHTVHTVPLWLHLLFTCALFFLSLAIALMIDNLGLAMAVIGSLSSINLAFVLPPICYIKSMQYGFLSFISEPTRSKQWIAWLAIYPPSFVALFGVCIAIYSLVSIAQGK